MLNYDGKRFRSIANSADGDVGDGTIFEYRQRKDIVWATYAGGGVRFGTLIAIADESGQLEMRYQHVSDCGELRTGRCTSRPSILADGRIRVEETWQWTSGGNGTGTSVIEELRE